MKRHSSLLSYNKDQIKFGFRQEVSKALVTKCLRTTFKSAFQIVKEHVCNGHEVEKKDINMTAYVRILELAKRSGVPRGFEPLLPP